LDAAHDYASAIRYLHNTFPAYVSYVQKTRAKIGPIDRSDEGTIVVRTSDGKVVSGKPSEIQINASSKFHGDAVEHSPFDPDCYAPVSASSTTFDGAPAEALALRGTCKSGHDDKDDASDLDFTTLYVNPHTFQPLSVSGVNNDDTVSVRLEEDFSAVDGHTVPSLLSVRVLGHGWMGWLDIRARVEYSRYQFLSSMP